MKILSKSAAQTKRAASKLAKRVSQVANSKSNKGHAMIIALTGDLGSGKTTFVQGFAKALGIKHRIVSPTFLIIRRYRVASRKKQGKIKNFYHVDLYRVHKIKELNALNFKSLLNTTNTLMLIEWAEKIKKLLPKGTIWVNFNHGRKETERIIAY